MVDAAVAARLLVEDEELGWVSFPHALVRSALVARTTRNREARHHLRTADVVEARADVLDREATVAQHLLAAGRLAPAVRTADACVAAGRLALSGISDEDGRAWAERALAALDVSGSDDVDGRRARGEALLLLIEAGRFLGDGPCIEVALAAAKDLARGDLAPEVLIDIACESVLFAAANDYPWALKPVDAEVMDLLERALAVVDPEDGVRRSNLLGWACTATTGSSENHRALAWSAEAIAVSAAGVDPTTRVRVLLNARLPLVTAAGLADRLATNDDMLQPGVHDFGMHLSARGFAHLSLLEAGRFAEARALHEEHQAIFETLDRPWYEAYAHLLDGLHAFLAGDVEGAEALYRHGMTIGPPNHTGAGSQFDHGIQVMSARARGREADLAPLAARVRAARPDLLVGEALAARADPAGAAPLDLGRLADAGEDLFGYLVLDLLAEVAWLRGGADLGAAVASSVEPYADRIGVIGQGAIVTGPMHRPHGLALAAAGSLEAAADALARAVAVGEEQGWRPTVGRASLERAVVLDRLGRTDEATLARTTGEAALADTPVAPLGPLPM